MPSRHPFKQTPRDTRAHGIIEWYLGEHGADSGYEHTTPAAGGHDAANEGRLCIRRGARHFGLSAAAWVIGPDGQPCVYDCQDPQAPHALVFSLHSKERGRAYVGRETGGDPARLKYNPYARRQV